MKKSKKKILTGLALLSAAACLYEIEDGKDLLGNRRSNEDEFNIIEVEQYEYGPPYSTAAAEDSLELYEKLKGLSDEKKKEDSFATAGDAISVKGNDQRGISIETANSAGTTGSQGKSESSVSIPEPDEIVPKPTSVPVRAAKNEEGGKAEKNENDNNSGSFCSHDNKELIYGRSEVSLIGKGDNGSETVPYIVETVKGYRCLDCGEEVIFNE